MQLFTGFCNYSILRHTGFPRVNEDASLTCILIKSKPDTLNMNDNYILIPLLKVRLVSRQFPALILHSKSIY